MLCLPTVDITYTHSITQTRLLHKAGFDLYQSTCANLKALYTQITTKVVNVPEINPLYSGLKFDGSRSSINTLTAKSRHVSNTAVTSDPDTGNISFRTDSGAHSSKNSAVNSNGNGNGNGNSNSYSPMGDIEQ